MRRQSAFSLMELIAVVVILGIIAAIIIPRVAESSAGSKVAVTANDIRLLANACSMYRVEHGVWPSDVNRGHTPAELERYFAPGDNTFGKECPLGGTYDWNGNTTPRSIEVLGNWTNEEKLAVDAMIDDGNLSTGSFQNGRRFGVEYLCY